MYSKKTLNVSAEKSGNDSFQTTNVRKHVSEKVKFLRWIIFTKWEAGVNRADGQFFLVATDNSQTGAIVQLDTRTRRTHPYLSGYVCRKGCLFVRTQRHKNRRGKRRKIVAFKDVRPAGEILSLT